ncbi:DUF6129 family protein [uncultured Cohaesibacter sp.]|uniref:DUF6129 family protein n=1 Tax=uncultured Cohaesibacter sp. TaxID=1002546 RepID=UPI002931F5B7|nr:DUF6129 family protein [uncultured Cohaesibacter sp.]
MIAEAVLDEIAAKVAESALNEQITLDLRKQWPDIHFTYCLDDDVCASRPARTHEDFNLYLVSGGGGCINFTSEPDSATGIVVAEIEDEEGEEEEE